MVKKKDTVLMKEADVRSCIRMLADMIVRRNPSVGSLVLLGIRTRGRNVAERVVEQIDEITGVKPLLGFIDPRPYRDDSKYDGEDETDIPFNVDNTIVILIDDVLQSGRTMRAAMDAVVKYGRPASIRVAVLIDRGQREYPITADYVGKVIPTSKNETIRLKLSDIDGGVDKVIIKSK
ncbi:bifunctional pyr operon transcriptional regulator/uracil phosphoribosyltransferase PyrR [Candidatus Altiarchaeota archaeon]